MGPGRQFADSSCRAWTFSRSLCAARGMLNQPHPPKSSILPQVSMASSERGGYHSLLFQLLLFTLARVVVTLRNGRDRTVPRATALESGLGCSWCTAHRFSYSWSRLLSVNHQARLVDCAYARRALLIVSHADGHSRALMTRIPHVHVACMRRRGVRLRVRALQLPRFQWGLQDGKRCCSG